MNTPERRELGPPVLALAVFAVSLWAQSPDAYAAVTDDGVYLVVAKALTNGQGLHFIHQPDTPAAAFLPPLFPALAGAIGVGFPDFPANLLLVQIMNAALLAGAAWLAAELARSLLRSPPVRYGVVAIGFTNVAVLSTATRSVPEPLLLFCWFAGFAAVRAVERNPRWAVAAGATAAAAVLTAYTGVALLLGVLGGLYFRRHRTAAGVASAVAAGLIVPWLWWSTAVARTPAASASIAMARSSVASSLVDAIRPFDPGVGLIGAGLLVVMGSAATLGAWRAWRVAPEWMITVAAHFVTLAVVPITQRSLWVLFPSVILLAAMAVQWGGDFQTKRRWPVVTAGALPALIIVLLNLVALWDRRFLPETTDATQEVTRRFLAGVGIETPARAVIATDADALLYLYTERATVPLIHPEDGVEDGDNLCADGADYVALSGLRPIDPADLPTNAHEVFALTDGPTLYRLVCE